MFYSYIDNYFQSKKRSLMLLGLTAIISSRALFKFFNDPEGPNLLIVGLMTLVVFFASYTAYNLIPSKTNGLKRFFPVLFIQFAVVAVFYFCLK